MLAFIYNKGNANSNYSKLFFTYQTGKDLRNANRLSCRNC